ncbi:MAG: hypothetical protein AAF518_14110 [Spirochaetota bacterium]
MKLQHFFCIYVLLGVSLIAKPALYYYDGTNKREITPENGIYADFSASSSRKNQIDPNQFKEISQQGKVKLLQARKTLQQSQTLQLSRKNKLSPVFRDVYGRNIAFPGNLIVYFPKKYSYKNIQQLAKKHNFQILRKLPMRIRNAYLIASEPGMKALETAAKIRKLPQVISVSPSVWTKINMR